MAGRLKLDKWTKQLDGLEGAWKGDTNQFLQEEGVEHTPYDGSLGTLGGGNHFAELQRLDKVHDQAFVEMAEAGTPLHVLEQIEGARPGTYRSVVFSLTDNDKPSWLKPWIGTIQWVNPSPYRPKHRRKNWFVGVEVLHQPDASLWRLADVRIDTFRASGPGGQHVNKTESAVRATHVPSGIVAIAQEGRSQFDNRQLALDRLKRRLQCEVERVHGQARDQLREKHNSLERGNSVMVFSGPDFRKLL